jgi:hypothetical protein
MTSAHSGSSGYSFAEASTLSTAASFDCGYSMLMFPVTFTEQHGRHFSVWETNVRNCWGGSRVSVHRLSFCCEPLAIALPTAKLYFFFHRVAV